MLSGRFTIVKTNHLGTMIITTVIKEMRRVWTPTPSYHTLHLFKPSALILAPNLYMRACQYEDLGKPSALI